MRVRGVFLHLPAPHGYLYAMPLTHLRTLTALAGWLIALLPLCVGAQTKPERVIVFIIDGLHHKAPDRLNMPNFNQLRKEGCYVNKSVMIAPHHPTVGDYGKQHTCSFPNPVLQSGTLLIKPEHTYLQEWFPKTANTFFFANTTAYNSVTRGFKYVVQDPSLNDEALVKQAMNYLSSGPVQYMRVHLQTPGNLGRSLSNTTPDKPYYRNLWGAGSPYVAQIEGADKLLGQFVAQLKTQNLWQSTLLLVTSDQGQSEIGWHPVIDPDSWVTPLVMVGPGIAAGRTLSYVEHTDLSPTLAKAVGIAAPQTTNLGKVVSSFFANEEETTSADPQLLWTINQQCNEYFRLRAKIQLDADKNIYSSSYLTFLENDLLTPEPFYHLDRFTEWHKAGSVSHLIENNEAILGQMRQYLGNADAEKAVAFSPTILDIHIQRLTKYHADSLAPRVTVMKSHWDKALQVNKYTYKWPSNGTWNPATYYAALADMWRERPQASWKRDLIDWGARNEWVPTNWDVDMANNHLAGHAWLNLYDQTKDTTYISGIRRELDRFMTIPFEGKDAWWWCDALYMAPTTFHHMTQTTGNPAYSRFAHEKWWVTTQLLQDPNEQLFYRDTHYVWQPEKLAFRPKAKSNIGGKVFWSRGNGWVVGGIVRVLPYLAKNDPERAKYVKQLKAMMAKIVSYQRPDGGWTVSLLDTTFKSSETSATALFALAMASGIRQGVLEAKKYQAPLDRAWLFLNKQITPTGKVIGAQRVGHDPTATQMEKPDHFSQGVWLAAAHELRKLYPQGWVVLR